MPVNKSGFTIVELLIVIVVIAILAAISIVAYNGIQARATDTAIATDLRDTITKIKLFQADTGSYPATSADLATLGLKTNTKLYNGSVNSYVYCRSADGSTAAIAAITQNGGAIRKYLTTSGTVTEMTVAEWGSNTTTRCATAVGSGGISPVSGVPTTSNVWATWTGAY